MGIPAAALPIAGGLVDTAIGGLFQSAANRKNRRWSEKMYHWQRADALADWNMQNEYNSPAAQMARLKEAGLNPNLVYGNGGSQVQAATVRSASMTQGQEQPLTGTRLGEAMAQYQSVQMANAQLTAQKLMQENLRKDLEVKDAEIAAKKAGTAKTLGETNLNKFDLDRKNELIIQIIEDAWAQTNLKKAQIDATVHANQRANELQQGALQLQKGQITNIDLDTANKRLENVRKAMENDQYSKMRPIELAQALAQNDVLMAQLAKLKQETKNEEQITRINKMEADLGKAMKIIQSLMGPTQQPRKR